ncbi:MAG TPA: hypothetical protein VHM90_04685, partial [Phycisphaerae bacterium]|nr:hypothetical protein [Phycisphaerae bacterium]
VALEQEPAAAPIVEKPAHFRWDNILGALFGLPFLAVGLFPIALGILFFFPSHAEVSLTVTEVISLERLGPVPIRQRRLIAQIQKMRIGPSFEKSLSPANFGIFVVLGDTARELRLAQRYPLGLINALAAAILQELPAHGNATVVLENPAPAAPSAAPEVRPPEPALPQPAASKIACVATPESITLVVPRTGFRGAARFFLVFSLFWNVLSVPFFVGVLLQFLHEPSLENLGIVGFLLIFVTIGTAFFLASIQTAFRKAVILATRDALIFTQTGPLRTSELQWSPAELAAIRCTDSNTAVNGQPLKQLSISTAGASPRVHGLFVGREEEELRWLASILNEFYGLARPQGAVAPDQPS